VSSHLTSATEQRHTAHGSRLSRTSFSSSDRLDCLKSVVELHCSNSIVELHCSLDDSFPARNSRAHANCSETQLRTHVFAGNSTHTDGTQLFSRSGDLVTSAPKHRHILQVAQRRADTGAHCHVTGRTATSSSAAQSQVHCHVTGPERFQQQHTRAHQKAN